MSVDFLLMTTNNDVAKEPVDVDDGIVDTGVLHELPEDDEEEKEEDEDLRA